MELNEILTLVFKIVVIVVPVLWALVKTKLKLDNDKAAKITGIVEIAVQETYFEFVREVKKNSSDGKLTAVEIKDARKKAWEKAKEIGKKQGLELAGCVAEEYFPVLIDKAIKKLKK